ncbi:MAG TPA: glycosyltransferase family 87 protein [Silvibacterium sp.]|nr:glycosyltransferase family 87 protein [Silvibacterium sp.]
MRAPLAGIHLPLRRITRWFDGTISRRVRWGTFGVGAIVLTLGALMALTSFSSRGPRHLHVFGTFWASGYAASHHLNPYGPYDLSYRFEDLAAHTHISLNLSPPPLLPVFQFVALFNPESAVRVWTFASLILFLLSLGLLMMEYGERVQRRQILWFLLGPAALDVLMLGQDYALLTFLVVVAWVLFERHRKVGFGIFLGLLVAAKPNLGLWPIFLAVGGHLRVAKICAVTVLVVGSLPLLFYGPGIYGEWLHAISNDPHWIFFSDVSLTGFAARLGHRAIGRVLSMLLLAGSTAFVFWKRPSAETSGGIAFCLGLLASPLGWIGYSLFLAPVLLRKRWSTKLTLAIAPLMLPFTVAVIAINTSHLLGIIAGLFYFLPVCFLLGFFLRTAAAESRASRESELATKRLRLATAPLLNSDKASSSAPLV